MFSKDIERDQWHEMGYLCEDIFITLLPHNASLNSRGHMEDLLI